MPLSDASRERLAKLLGMLGSDHNGEVANAGRAAHKMVKEAGMTWVEVLQRQKSPSFTYQKPHYQAWEPPSPSPQDSRQIRISSILKQKDKLSAREIEFLESISRRRKGLTELQESWLSDIERRFKP